MTPSIPYIDIPPLHLFGPAGPIGEVSIKPFGTMVAIGVFIGIELARKQGNRLKLDEATLSSFIWYILAGGFVGGHVLDTIFYRPEHLVSSPLSLLWIWDGQSSFGGFTGAFIGLVIWRRRFKASALRYADVVASAFPAAWVFGRTGCSIAHDHPGMPSDLWLAVAFPGGGRFDLGLMEMVLTIPLAITFLLLVKKPRPPGFFIGTMCVAYAPIRFGLDFLRARDVSGADPRYAGLTPAQWACMILLAAGIYFVRHAARMAECVESWHPAHAIDPSAGEKVDRNTDRSRQ
jgi:phosphatidylglycerol---prolipoprotein diacylglyceryl transferase